MHAWRRCPGTMLVSCTALLALGACTASPDASAPSLPDDSAQAKVPMDRSTGSAMSAPAHPSSHCAMRAFSVI